MFVMSGSTAGKQHKNDRGKSKSGSFLDWIFSGLMKRTGNMGNASKTTINKTKNLTPHTYLFNI